MIAKLESYAVDQGVRLLDSREVDFEIGSIRSALLDIMDKLDDEEEDGSLEINLSVAASPDVFEVCIFDVDKAVPYIQERIDFVSHIRDSFGQNSVKVYNGRDIEICVGKYRLFAFLQESGKINICGTQFGKILDKADVIDYLKSLV